MPSAAALALQDKDGPKALDEFCRDLCEEVRMNKVDPVSAPNCGAGQQLAPVCSLVCWSLLARLHSDGAANCC